jgi:hypothetical protein
MVNFLVLYPHALPVDGRKDSAHTFSEWRPHSAASRWDPTVWMHCPMVGISEKELAPMGSCMTVAEVAGLQDVNRRLQAVVVRLTRLVVGRIAEATTLPDGLDRGVAAGLNDAARRLETVATLRDAAVECAHLARDTLEPIVARELEEMSVELADGAAKLEASLG